MNLFSQKRFKKVVTLIFVSSSKFSVTSLRTFLATISVIMNECNHKQIIGSDLKWEICALLNVAAEQCTVYQNNNKSNNTSIF